MLRRELKRLRLDMSSGEVEAKSLVIAGKLIGSVAWAGIKNMHVYSTVTAWNEVETEPVIEYLKKHQPEIAITSPAVSTKQELPKQQFDLIIVPCLGFDKELYRLGLGAGFYDRFLANQVKALKIGLGFAAGLVKPGLPHEPHDVPLDRIITEEGIIKTHDS